MIKISKVKRYDSNFRSTIVSLVFNHLKCKFKNISFSDEFSLFKGFAFKANTYTQNGKKIIRVSDIKPTGEIISKDKAIILTITLIKKWDRYLIIRRAQNPNKIFKIGSTVKLKSSSLKQKEVNYE